MHLFTDMVATGKIKPSAYTLAAMVKLYGKCDRSDDAVNLVGKMEEQFGLKPLVVIFTCLMRGCIQDKRFGHVFNVFEQSKKAGIQPDTMTHQTHVDGCRQAANRAKAIELVSEALANKADLTPEFLRSGGFHRRSTELIPILEPGPAASPAGVYMIPGQRFPQRSMPRTHCGTCRSRCMAATHNSDGEACRAGCCPDHTAQS